MSPEISDPARFIHEYPGETPVRVGGMTISLAQAQQAEALLCQATPDRRQDPGRRARYYAGMLAAAGSLQKEHEYLLLEETE